MHTATQNSRPQYCAITVPSAIPAKPRPGHEPIPRPRMMLATMLTPFTIRSFHIELIESCIPTNQPLNVISATVAGAAQIRMRKYCDASDSTSSVAWVQRSASFKNGSWRARITSAITADIAIPLQNIFATSRLSPAP